MTERNMIYKKMATQWNIKKKLQRNEIHNLNDVLQREYNKMWRE